MYPTDLIPDYFKNTKLFFSRNDIENTNNSAERWSDLLSREVDKKTANKLNKDLKKGLTSVFIKPGAKTVFEKDWDVCFVLDACSYDVFRELSQLKGKLTKEISWGFNTARWTVHNIREEHRDTIFLYTNPWVARIVGEENLKKYFYYHEGLWKEHWSEQHRTVMASDALNKADFLIPRYKDKKFLVFLLQPHDPFYATSDFKVADNSLRWVEDFYKGNTRPEVMVEAYKNNLKMVLHQIGEFQKKFKDKKIIITADHGESLGQYGVCYSHKGGYLPWLVEVPWFEFI